MGGDAAHRAGAQPQALLAHQAARDVAEAVAQPAVEQPAAAGGKTQVAQRQAAAAVVRRGAPPAEAAQPGAAVAVAQPAVGLQQPFAVVQGLLAVFEACARLVERPRGAAGGGAARAAQPGFDQPGTRRAVVGGGLGLLRQRAQFGGIEVAVLVARGLARGLRAAAFGLQLFGGQRLHRRAGRGHRQRRLRQRGRSGRQQAGAQQPAGGQWPRAGQGKGACGGSQAHAGCAGSNEGIRAGGRHSRECMPPRRLARVAAGAPPRPFVNYLGRPALNALVYRFSDAGRPPTQAPCRAAAWCARCSPMKLATK